MKIETISDAISALIHHPHEYFAVESIKCSDDRIFWTIYNPDQKVILTRTFDPEVLIKAAQVSKCLCHDYREGKWQ